MLGTDPVLPLAIAELELLGLLGPEPGALLQREETGRETQTHTEKEREEIILIIHKRSNVLVKGFINSKFTQ